MRNRWYGLGLGLFGALFLVVGLFVYARYRLRTNEAFERRFAPHILGRKQSLHLPYNSFYLAGADSTQLYLGNHLQPTLLLSVDRITLDTNALPVAFPDSLLAKTGWQWQFQAGAAYCFNYLSGDLCWWPDSQLSQSFQQHRFTPIQQLLALSRDQVVIKTFDAGMQRRVLQSVHLRTKTISGQYYPTQATEGIYSTSGNLTYDAYSAQLLYIHHYWNRIQRLDTLLNPREQAHTIDLQNNFDLVVTQYGDPKAPRIMAGGNLVNKHSAVSGNHLLVLSGQAARNQTLAQLQSQWTIDVYQRSEVTYRYSFYLPRQKGSNSLDFLLLGQQLFALEGNTLTRYDLQLPRSR